MFETNTQNNLLNNSVLISLARAAQLTGYHQDYLGQLCRAGKLPATKKGRIWFTSEDALNNLSVVEEAEEEINQEQASNDLLEVASPEIVQTITMSEVDGMPIAIRTKPMAVQGINSVQNVLTALRMEALQREVYELRDLLSRLMAEVSRHGDILKTWPDKQRASDRLRHSYIPSFDFNTPYVSSNAGQEKTPRLTGLWTPIIPAATRPSTGVWVVAGAVAIVVAAITTGMVTGDFFGPTASEVNTVYYQSLRQSLPKPILAESPLQPTVAGDILPTESVGELR